MMSAFDDNFSPEPAPASAGACALDNSASIVEAELLRHFNERWGQHPPLLEAEAAFLAKAILASLGICPPRRAL
jgi:hypothetical protein